MRASRVTTVHAVKNNEVNFKPQGRTLVLQKEKNLILLYPTHSNIFRTTFCVGLDPNIKFLTLWGLFGIVS